MRPRFWTTALAASLLAVAAPSARATDGHFLHGVGAVNSALGGIGVGAPSSLLGAFYVNPAGLVTYRGTTTELGFEMFKPNRTIASSAGGQSGSTTSSSEFVPIPAFGWSRELKSDRLVVGVAGLGIGGFGVDYRTDQTNPILAPRPYGFGAVYSNFSLMKIIPGIGYRVNDRVRVGGAMNLDWASLAVDPMPVAAPAVDAGPDGIFNTADDRAYYSRATDADGSFGIGAQVGVQVELSTDVWAGLAYTTPQVFQRFRFDGVYENPNLPSFGMPRTIQFAMDVPAVYAGGIAFAPGMGLLAGIDAKYIDYAHTRGFDKKGFGPDGAVLGFGWRSIWSVGTGIEVKPNAVAFRIGYNYSQNPIPSDMAMFNAPAPAVVKHHATAGLGYTFESGLTVDLAYYRAFKGSVEGPFQTPAGALGGTSVKSSLSEQSVLLGFTFAPPR